VADLPLRPVNLTPEVQAPSAPRSTRLADTRPACVRNHPEGRPLGVIVGAEMTLRCCQAAFTQM
jgi:hypothetical protein